MTAKLAEEIYLAARLKGRNVPCNAFDGLTTIEQRKQRFREAIRAAQVEAHFGAQFRETYGEPL